MPVDDYIPLNAVLLKLAVAAFLTDFLPAVRPQCLDHIPHLHSARTCCRLRGLPTCFFPLVSGTVNPFVFSISFSPRLPEKAAEAALVINKPISK